MAKVFVFKTDHTRTHNATITLKNAHLFNVGLISGYVVPAVNEGQYEGGVTVVECLDTLSRKTGTGVGAAVKPTHVRVHREWTGRLRNTETGCYTE